MAASIFREQKGVESLTQYMIESIGAQFSDRDLPALANRFTSRAAEGYRLHSVFQVTQPPGCAIGGSPTITYLAVYVKEE